MIFFIKKLILFLLPIGCVLVIPFMVLYTSREYYSVQATIGSQTLYPEILYGVAYSNLDFLYKKDLVLKRDPEVVVMGSSRSLEFRKEFFIRPNTFINASSAGRDLVLDRTEKFLHDLPIDSNVKIIILSLDQEMFRPDTPQLKDSANYDQDLPEWFMGSWTKIYKDWFSGKFKLSSLYTRSRTTHNIGLNALIHNDGFRSDGSYQYKSIFTSPDFEKTLAEKIAYEDARIINNRSSFKYSTTFSDEPVEHIKNILKIADDRGIKVIGILPPQPSRLYVEIIQGNDSYATVAKNLPAQLRQVFSVYGFSFYDFSDIRTIGGKDSEFVDIDHSTDKMALRMMVYIAEKNKDLKGYLDPHILMDMLVKNKADFLSF